MIILYDEQEIIDMLDTAEEFKSFIYDKLCYMERELKKENLLDNGLLFNPKKVHEVSFHNQLKQYLDMTGERIEFK